MLPSAQSSKKDPLKGNTDVPSSADGSWPEAWARRGVWAAPVVCLGHLRWLMHEVKSFTIVSEFSRVRAMTLE